MRLIARLRKCWREHRQYGYLLRDAWRASGMFI